MERVFPQFHSSMLLTDLRMTQDPRIDYMKEVEHYINIADSYIRVLGMFELANRTLRLFNKI